MRNKKGGMNTFPLSVYFNNYPINPEKLFAS